MAFLLETGGYPSGVYQIETTDPVVGGVPDEATKAGLSNIPAMQLAKRTAWLKGQVDLLSAAVAEAITEEDVDALIAAAVASLVGGAPGALDTLNELAAALGDNENFAASVTSALAGKVSTSDISSDVDFAVDPAKVPTRAAIKTLVDAVPSPVKAWVNFDGNGAVSIREALNISSITDLGTGHYRLNFATPMASENYAWAYSLSNTADNYLETIESKAQTAAYLDVFARRADPGLSASYDPAIVSVIIFQ